MTLVDTLLFGLVVLITHFMEGLAGFGCTILALPFCIALAGINVAVPVLIVLAWVLVLYVVVIDYKNIVWKEFIKIVSFVILGLPIGMWAFSSLPEVLLKRLLGVFMIVVSLRGLYLAFFAKAVQVTKTEMSKWKKYALNGLLFLGGIIHGAFSSGGPFVIIYAAQALPDKSQFRATLCMLWLALNSLMIITNFTKGVMTFDVLRLIGWSLPFLVAGMLLGNYAHHKVKGDVFVKIVYAVLFLSGLFMFR